MELDRGATRTRLHVSAGCRVAEGSVPSLPSDLATISIPPMNIRSVSSLLRPAIRAAICSDGTTAGVFAERLVPPEINLISLLK
jgi:hypothetical protein